MAAQQISWLRFLTLLLVYLASPSAVRSSDAIEDGHDFGDLVDEHDVDQVESSGQRQGTARSLVKLLEEQEPDRETGDDGADRDGKGELGGGGAGLASDPAEEVDGGRDGHDGAGDGAW